MPTIVFIFKIKRFKLVALYRYLKRNIIVDFIGNTVVAYFYSIPYRSRAKMGFPIKDELSPSGTDLSICRLLYSFSKLNVLNS